MKMQGSNILITLILPAYLNILAINSVRYNPEKFTQENPKISGNEFSMDDRGSNLHYYDAYISESIISVNRDTIFYDEYPLIISGINESIPSFIDLPPPEHKN
jgi:hypothetical protein